MSYDPPASEPERLRFYITDIELEPPIIDPSVKINANIFVDEELAYSFPWLDHTQPSRWSRLLLCEVSPSSNIVLRLCRSLKDKQRPFTFPSFQISEVDETTDEIVLARPEIFWTVMIKCLAPTMAEQLYSTELSKLGKIEDIYDSLEPDVTTKYVFKSAIHFASIAAENLPQSTSKLSFLIIVKTWRLLEQQIQLDAHVQDILRGLIRIRDIVEVLSQASSSMLATALEGSRGSISHILLLLEDVSVYIFNRLVSKDSGSVNGDEIAASSTHDVGAYLTKLEDLQKSFYASWMPPAAPYVDSISVVDDEPSDLEQEDLQDAVDEPPPKPNPYEILNLLRPMDPNGYDPDRACMDGTREAILNRVITWTQNRENSETFMWISGQAGMGKTSIAASLCRKLDRMKALAGSFFCERDVPESIDPLRLVNNLVHTVALRLPAYAHEVAKAIRADRSLCNSHLSLRYEGLIKKPLRRLKSLSTPATLIIIIDGLDECGGRGSRARILHKLYDMSRLVPWLKIIVTARPEGDLVEYFQRHIPHEPIVRLQTYDASDDIRAFIQAQLGEFAQKDRWPNYGIGQLCTMAEGVFLWAALAVEYLKTSSIPSRSRLQKVLENGKSPVTEHLDALYTRALGEAMKDSEDETVDAYTECIGAILATTGCDPFTISGLQSFLLASDRIEEGTLERVIHNLGPLVIVTDGQYVRFHHSSFKDYVSNSLRSNGSPIQPTRYELNLAECCFKIMQKELRFNMCRLETSHLLNNEVPDLKNRIRSHIGPALKYACLHWVDHFSGSPKRILIDNIMDFMKGPRLMFWIEVLSLVGRMDAAISGLQNLTLIELTEHEHWKLIISWAKDAHRFILTFYDAITASTPHLYISALAFSPTKSLTAQRMRPYFPNTITISRGGDLAWHPCLSTIHHPYAVQSMAISPDGVRIITGYSDGSLRMWDRQSSACVGDPLTGHTGSVTCVLFSPGGQIAASSSQDTTIRVWDLTDGLKITSRVLMGHTGFVHSIAFSPNATIIASGSSDKTIRLWDYTTMRALGNPFTAHSSRVSSVAFSPDGTKLVSGSWDKTVCLWSVGLDGKRLDSSPLVITGHSDSVTCVSFSPDGLKIASGSVDRTLQIWDIQTSRMFETYISPPKHSDEVTSIAFSPNGKLIASSSLDGAINLYDALSLTAYSRPFGHFNAVNTIIFSPDGAHIISGSLDTTTRVWEVDAFLKSIPAAPMAGHSSPVESIAVSRDDMYIVSGSHDQTVRIWDAQTGSQIGDPYVGHSNQVYCVAISPDGARIASGAFDKTLNLWAATTRTPISSYQHNQYIWGVAFSPNGTLIAFGSDDGKVSLWDSTTRKITGNALQGHSNYVFSVAFSPDGTCLASASGDSTIILWDVKTGNRMGGALSGHTSGLRSVAFSPCGTQLISGSDDQTLRLWDIKTGNTLQELKGHSSSVQSVDFSPDGSCIASGSDDKTVRLWSVETGQAIGKPLIGHSSHVKCIAFSRDGRCVFSCSTDKSIRAWNLDALDSVTETAQDPPGTFCWPKNPYELSSHPHHGWVTQGQHLLAFWLPPQYLKPDQFFNLRSRGLYPQASLDYSKFVQGTAWTKVASDSIAPQVGPN